MSQYSPGLALEDFVPSVLSLVAFLNQLLFLLAVRTLEPTLVARLGRGPAADGSTSPTEAVP